MVGAMLMWKESLAAGHNIYTYTLLIYIYIYTLKVVSVDKIILVLNRRYISQLEKEKNITKEFQEAFL